MRKSAVAIAVACLKRSRFMEIFAFSGCLTPLHGVRACPDWDKKSFSHGSCPEVRLWEVAHRLREDRQPFGQSSSNRNQRCILRVVRDPTEVLKFYATNPRRRRQSSFSSSSHSGLRLRQERMSRKVRELIAQNWRTALSIAEAWAAKAISRIHKVARPVTISGNAGGDAKKYQEKAVKAAIAEARK